jgi:hypothetical protein
MCKHKNIEIHRVSTYIIPQGWTELVEQDDIDLDKGKCETCLYEEDCKWGAKR